MSEPDKRLEVRFGTFACKIEGYDDPTEKMRNVLGMVQRMVTETPALAYHTYNVPPQQITSLFDRTVQGDHSDPSFTVIDQDNRDQYPEIEDATEFVEAARVADDPADENGDDGGVVTLGVAKRPGEPETETPAFNLFAMNGLVERTPAEGPSDAAPSDARDVAEVPEVMSADPEISDVADISPTGADDELDTQVEEATAGGPDLTVVPLVVEETSSPETDGTAARVPEHETETKTEPESEVSIGSADTAETSDAIVDARETWETAEEPAPDETVAADQPETKDPRATADSFDDADAPIDKDDVEGIDELEAVEEPPAADEQLNVHDFAKVRRRASDREETESEETEAADDHAARAIVDEPDIGRIPEEADPPPHDPLSVDTPANDHASGSFKEATTAQDHETLTEPAPAEDPERERPQEMPPASALSDVSETTTESSETEPVDAVDASEATAGQERGFSESGDVPVDDVTTPRRAGLFGRLRARMTQTDTEISKPELAAPEEPKTVMVQGEEADVDGETDESDISERTTAETEDSLALLDGFEPDENMWMADQILLNISMPEEQEAAPEVSPKAPERPARRVSRPRDIRFSAAPEAAEKPPGRTEAPALNRLQKRILAAAGEADPQPESDPAPEAAVPQDGSITPADIAERCGAETIPDLLAAAAAWLTFVEAKNHFTRREVTSIYDTMPGDQPKTLEAKIKGYGKLVRAGVLLSVGENEFALAPEERERLKLYLTDL